VGNRKNLADNFMFMRRGHDAVLNLDSGYRYKAREQDGLHIDSGTSTCCAAGKSHS